MSSETLAELIAKHRERNNWSYRDISNRAQAAGHQLSKSRAQELGTLPVTSLTVDAVKGLAAGLGIPESAVVQAAFTSMGFEFPDKNLTPEEAIARDPDLTETERNSLLAQIRVLRESADDLIGKYGLAARRGKKDD